MATEDELKTWLGKPRFKRRVTYAYSPTTNAFTFFADDRGRHMHPIGVFSPIVRHGITYDIEGMCEEIAEHMSLFDNTEYFDISTNDEE